MEIKTTNLYYFYNINIIGGIETFFYQLVKKYQKYDLTIVYRIADPIQLERLKKYVRCVKFNDQHFICERAFFNFNTDIINNISAKDYILVIHGDYKEMIAKRQIDKAPEHSKITRYVACSKRAAAAYTQVTGNKCEVCYNPFVPEEPKRVLNLISATRLTKEKGKNRMIKFAKLLDDAKIPYIWTIFTNDIITIDNPNVIYMKPKLNIRDYIGNADYLVQLSDNEGYCYSVVEALSEGTPVIVTPCPVFDELGLVNGKNCYICDFDMKKVPIREIYYNIPHFTYAPPQDNWDNLLIHVKSDYQEKKNSIYTVEALSTYKDLKVNDKMLHKQPKKGDQWKVDYNRLQILLGDNIKQVPFVKVIKREIKK